MFGGGTVNPYDEIIAKTTDENLTSENWELIINCCDKVQDEGQEGAHNAFSAIQKRLAHRNPNVQLYALSLAESLSKNVGIEVNREIASKAFTQVLEKLITDRNTHEKVRRRALGLIAVWKTSFEDDPTLGVMEDCFNSLKAKNYKFETPQEPAPPAVDDEIRRKEEEELQRVLEMSMQDKGGRSQWSTYSPSASSSSAGASGSGSGLNRHASTLTSKVPSTAPMSTSNAPATPRYQAGYAPARTPSPVPAITPTEHVIAEQHPTLIPSPNIVTRVRALHTFEPTEPGELAFEKGDVIKVVDRGYKDWWRGQLKGRTGIFPVNYVEPMPEPTPAELAKEAEQEAAVFAQAVNVEKLLNMLRSLDPAKDNLADNEEIQELYRSSMALRPKIVKLIDKYSQKRADLVSMNETFVRARTIFDRMMEESLARHSGAVYEQTLYRPPATQYLPETQSRHPDYAQGSISQSYGWSPTYDQPSGYSSFPTPGTAYQGQLDPASGTAAYPGPGPASGSPFPPQTQGYTTYTGQGIGVQYGPQGPTLFSTTLPQQQTQSHGAQQVPTPQPQPQPQTQYQAQSPIQQPAVAVQPELLPQPQPQPQTTSPQPLPQQQQQDSGPPYVFNPSTTYADPNVQAWAQYYAKGGKDPAGSVYFISVPGVSNLTQGGSPHSQQANEPSMSQQIQSVALHPNDAAQSSIPETAAQIGPPEGRLSIDSLPYPGDVAALSTDQGNADSPPNPHSQYTDNSPQSQHSQAHSYSTNPTLNNHPVVADASVISNSIGAAPSWVLPKRTSPGPGQRSSVSSNSGSSAQGLPSAPGYLGVQNQFVGMNLSDRMG